jgi:hypothetical protein
MRSIVAGRRSHEIASFGAIEHPDDEQVRKAFNIREATLKFWPYLKRPFRFVLRAEPLRNLLSVPVRASYMPNRLY